MNVNVLFHGLVCEVQIHLGDYLALKEGAHPAYELCRSLGLAGDLPATQVDISFNLSEPLGMNIDPDNLEVVSVVPGAQAQRRGVMPGSRIVAVDGVAVNSYAEFMARRQARIDAGAATLALRFVDSAPAMQQPTLQQPTTQPTAQPAATLQPAPAAP